MSGIALVKDVQVHLRYKPFAYIASLTIRTRDGHRSKCVPKVVKMAGAGAAAAADAGDPLSSLLVHPLRPVGTPVETPLVFVPDVAAAGVSDDTFVIPFGINSAKSPLRFLLTITKMLSAEEERKEYELDSGPVRVDVGAFMKASGEFGEIGGVSFAVEAMSAARYASMITGTAPAAAAMEDDAEVEEQRREEGEHVQDYTQSASLQALADGTSHHCVESVPSSCIIVQDVESAADSKPARSPPAEQQQSEAETKEKQAAVAARARSHNTTDAKADGRKMNRSSESEPLLPPASCVEGSVINNREPPRKDSKTKKYNNDDDSCCSCCCCCSIQ